MKVKINNNANLLISLNKVTDKMAADMKIALIDAAAEIDMRTSSGKNIDGGSFAPYRPSTKKQKIRDGKQSSPVNLTNTGKMLAAASKVTIEKTNTKIIGKIGFTSGAEAQKAKWNQEGSKSKNRPPRPFFGLAQRQIERIVRRLKGE